MKKVTTLAISLIVSLIAFAQPCSELFFSEYVEGSSNNKALEIYNPTYPFTRLLFTLFTTKRTAMQLGK
jgi:predicted extracellular nuclease